MATAQNKIILDQVQVALFPNDFEITNPSVLSAKLLESNFITGEKLIINSFLTNKAPGEIVRVEAVLEDNPNLQLMIAPIKVSLYFKNPASEPNFEISFVDLEKQVKKLYELILDGKSFNRVGYIITTFKVVESPVALLKKKIKFNGNDELRDAEMKLTFDTKFSHQSWKGTKFNKYITITNGYLTNDHSQKTVILQHDLNVRQEQNPKWRIDDVMEFLKQAHERSSNPEMIFSETLK